MPRLAPPLRRTSHMLLGQSPHWRCSPGLAETPVHCSASAGETLTLSAPNWWGCARLSAPLGSTLRSIQEICADANPLLQVRRALSMSFKRDNRRRSTEHSRWTHSYDAL